ncbi:MAG: lysyl-tRNA synthetase, partial [uncultured bacterium]
MEEERYILKERRNKLEAIRNAGIDPYPSKAERTNTNADALKNFEKLLEKELVLVGRIMTFRKHGKLTFAQIEDGTGKIQIAFKENVLGDKKYKFLKNFDSGDYIQASGKLFTTKKGEKTLEVKECKILAKSLLPLPEKWHGLKDEEKRYRHRYLELLMSSDLKK